MAAHTMSASLIRSPFTLVKERAQQNLHTIAQELCWLHTFTGRRSALSSRVEQALPGAKARVVHAEAAQAGTDAGGMPYAGMLRHVN